MLRPTARLLWTLLALGGLGLAAGSLILTAWMDLYPCSLCIFQRTLFIVIGLLALAAAWLGARRTALIPGVGVLLCAAAGLGIATYQVWLQALPPGTATCGGGPLGFIDNLVFWMGEQVPFLFLATGLCDEAGPPILGLSLARWAQIGFTATLAWALWALWDMTRRTRGSAADA